MLSFESASLASAATAGVVGTLLIVSPTHVFRLLGVDEEPNAKAFFFMRRAAVIMGGLGLVFYTSRNAPPGSLAREVSQNAAAVSFLGLAALGSAELARGAAGSALCAAIGVEVFLGASMLAGK